MDSYSTPTTTVKLKKASEESVAEVVIGISVLLGAKAKEPQLQMDLIKSLHAGEECLQQYKSLDDLFIACQLSAITGVEQFRKQSPSQFAYRITVLEGRNLLRDCTVGFALAGFMAVARAVGVPAEPPEGSYGWVEA